MTARLPPREGEWIDRSRPIEFRFEGAAYQGYHGDVLSSALWANGVRLLGRSFKYHRPRGIYSLANCDINLLVEDGTHTNIRGDVLPLTEGLNVRAVNTIGGLTEDRLSIVDWFGAFLPVGFYYKAFHTPRRLFPFYERQMRKVAGLGQINPAGRIEAAPKEYATCDILVIGAGASGLGAAIASAEKGLRVLLVDEQPNPGGSLHWQHGNEGRRRLQELLDQAATLDTLEVRCDTQAGGWYADHWVALFDRRGLTKVRARALVMAAGCIEQPAVFANNDLPGVMLSSAARRLLHLFAVKPCDRCVLLAGNAEGYTTALELHEAGVEVTAIADLRPAGENGDLAHRVAAAGIAVHAGHAIYEALPAAGKASITGAVLHPTGTEQNRAAHSYECDGIIISVGWAPNADLLYQAGGRFRYADHVEQFVPQTLPAGVFAAGRVNGVFDLDARIADGQRAGLAAAAHLGRHDGSIPDQPRHEGPPPSHPYPIFPHQKKKCFVDLDEDIHLADFVNAHQEGYDNIELLKRYTTVGMGPTQGKLANMNAIRILARLNGRSIDDTGTTTSRPFHHPVPMAHLAGRRFHPVRRTPMHDWHGATGAVFTYVGAWLRPECYPPSGNASAAPSRDEVILDEARNVRRGVGLIDIGTLGKIEVSGPDAATFLERVYTSRFANLPVGRGRYAVACDESGVLIEDGLVARMAPHRFYVTATTTGVGAFFQEMQRWAILWRSNVILVNATGHWSAMNVTGPRSRVVLAALTPLDLAPGAFPYLGARETAVAGVPARVLRVGFVGELGYEIHVPAGQAFGVWSALMEAGKPHGIRPFGVEAQRLLRLEKGHLIIGQDTDALTNPFEVNLEWALGKNKPFFVGQRSLAILKRQPLTRRLVGIAFGQHHPGPLPEECHLVFEGKEVVGRVTSIARHSTLGRPLGMAYVHPDLATAGRRITIRDSDGRLIPAEVAALPFYDPDNQRQQ
jgi:sarcosine oxidase subunit alpha